MARAMMALPSLTSRALTQANRDCVIRTVTGRARRDEKDRANAMTRRESRQVVAGRGRWTDQVAGAMMAMPSFTSQAFTQANRDCEIRTVTGRARRDEKDKARAPTKGM
jgi:hypothetical protein